MSVNMFEQLQSMKAKMEETKDRLDQVIVEGDAAGGAVKVKISGNRRVKGITIDPMLFDSEHEEIEDLLTIAFNRALEKADQVHEIEMQNSAKSMLSGFNM
jgi:DNA-binding YbaB/EbfC family protein